VVVVLLLQPASLGVVRLPLIFFLRFDLVNHRGLFLVDEGPWTPWSPSTFIILINSFVNKVSETTTEGRDFILQIKQPDSSLQLP